MSGYKTAADQKRDEFLSNCVRCAIDGGHEITWGWADNENSDYLYFFCAKCHKNMVVDDHALTCGGTMCKEKCPLA
jgi:hypothetical protein